MVSVIIPAYNSEKYLGMAVESALRQTYQDFEIIIIDDKSTDGTLVRAHSFAAQDGRIRVISNTKNLGAAGSRNKGIAAAAGEYVAFLDADDFWMPDKLEKQLAAINGKRLDLCYTAYGFMDSAGERFGKVYHVPETAAFSKMLKENVIGCSTVVLRRELLKEAKMRGEYAHEDYVLWLELLRGGRKAGGVNEPLMLFRKTEQGRSFNKVNSARNRFRVYRDFLGMSLPASAMLFIAYVINGVKKHYM